MEESEKVENVEVFVLFPERRGNVHPGKGWPGRYGYAQTDKVHSVCTMHVYTVIILVLSLAVQGKSFNLQEGKGKSLQTSNLRLI